MYASFAMHNVLRKSADFGLLVWCRTRSPNILREGHISYYTIRRPDFLRIVSVSWYVTLYQIKILFVSISYFFIIDKMASPAGWNEFAGRSWPAGRSLETPGVEGPQLFSKEAQKHGEELRLGPSHPLLSGEEIPCPLKSFYHQVLRKLSVVFHFCETSLKYVQPPVGRS